MEVSINQKLTDIPENQSVHQLVLSLYQSVPRGIAVAVNQAVVPRSQWTGHLLSSQDQITLISATSGG